ncbi:MAG: flagellar basal body-associated FliL family protein [Nitrospinae bacterium]|nr:flagellar basal body-associated FliL family protein [Nitrospinota bacterium]
MAQKDAKTEDASLSSDEASELERLLEEAGIKEEAVAAGTPLGLPARLRSLFKTKKKLIIIAGAALLTLLAGGIVAVYFFMGKPAEKVEEETAKKAPEAEAPEAGKIQKVNIFKLDPFFIPLVEDDKETGEFVTVTPYLLMSNVKLDREINRNLYLIRKNIYSILRRKRPDDYKKDKLRTEERLKKEVLTAANTLLLSGTGTITDVLFTEFIVR